MPIHFRIDAVAHLVRVEMTGEVTLEEILAYRRSLETAPGYDARLPRLIDARGVTEAPGTNTIRAVALRNQGDRGVRHGRRAIVATSDVAYGMFRMLEIMSRPGGVEYGTFRTMAEAEAWLGMSPPGPPLRAVT